MMTADKTLLEKNEQDARLSGVLTMKWLYVILLFCLPLFTLGQHGNIWCFGDSAGINFSNLSNPTPFQSAVDARGSCCAIADTTGSLLFYASTDYYLLWQQGYSNLSVIYNKNHQVMQNGDSIVGQGWYNELVIVPFPEHPDLFYLFSVGETTGGPTGLFYSTIDMSMNGGLGGVTQKNIQLLSYQAQDGIKAIKHGNGIDWWLMFRNWGGGNQFYLFLVDSTGIHPQLVQSVGSISTGGTLEEVVFTQNGSRFFLKNDFGLLERFDFDRCSGLVSNPFNIIPEGSGNFFVGMALSKNDSVLYLTIHESSNHGYLYQYNLIASNIAASKIIIFDFDYAVYPPYAVGFLRLAPDDKIYLSNRDWGNGSYYDSADYSSFNMNLSVINTPNSVGTTCAFQPYSFYLGGARTYWGLPNNPDYDLPRDSGSVCDTVQWTGINAQEAVGKGQLFVTYISDWQKVFINAKDLKGKNCLMQVFDITGKKVYEVNKQTVTAGYFTFDLDCNAFATGMYIVKLQTEKEMLATKFIKN